MTVANSQHGSRDRSPFYNNIELNSANNLKELESGFNPELLEKSSALPTPWFWLYEARNRESSWIVWCPDFSPTELWDNKFALFKATKFREFVTETVKNEYNIDFTISNLGNWYWHSLCVCSMTFSICKFMEPPMQ